jgi:GAF domain-containing protein/two-component sensor histidine kinase
MKPNISTSPEKNMTAERLQALYELIGRMNSVYELPELLDFVVDRALSLTGGRRGLLLLNDIQESGLLLYVTSTRGKKLDTSDLERVMNFVSTTVIRDVLDRSEPRLVVDLPADQRYEGDLTATGQFKQVRSVLAVPLKIEEQLVGLIYIDHPRQAIFGQDDLDFLNAFANQAALAINRARQHQRQVEELTLLNELSRSVVQVLDLDEVLTRIVTEVCRMLNVETGSVLLPDETTSELAFATSVSKGQRINITTRLKPAEGIAGWVMTHGQPACVNSVAQDPRWFGEVQENFKTRSLLCVPLKLEERVLGVLQALNKKSPAGFNSGDITLLSAFAASATIALENARLFREAGQVHQLRALNAVALALSSTLDLDRILNTGLDHALLMLQAGAGAIHLLGDEAEAGYSSVQISRGLTGQQLEALDDLINLVNGHNLDKALVIDQVVAGEEGQSQLLFGAGIEAIALAPIKVGREVSGTLAVMSRSPRTGYTDEEINLLVSIARIIGLAAQNATHYNQVRSQAMHLAYLNEVGGALTSSLDLTRILQVIIEGVRSLLETERVSVFLIDPDTDELVLRYGTEGDVNIRLLPGQGIAGWVASHDQPTLVNDTLSDPRHLRQIAVDTGYDAYSILCVPLKIEGKVIGVVEVLNKTGGRPFNHRDQIVLTDLSRWAAIALHNARLFEERVQAYRHLATEQKRRTAAEMRGAMADVILGMAHTMNNVVGAIRVWALTLENESLSSDQAALFKKVIGQIRQNSEEALELIRNMRGPLEKVTLAPTDVHRCLAAAIQSCWWPDNVQLHKEYAPDLPLVKANAQRLETVFHNLLSNSIQALAETGGEIWLWTGLTATGDVEISITDNGPGIPPHLQDHLFDPGVSSKNGGLGIGLWLVETFVQQFGGNIKFNSSAEGTTFTVTLGELAYVSAN